MFYPSIHRVFHPKPLAFAPFFAKNTRLKNISCIFYLKTPHSEQSIKTSLKKAFFFDVFSSLIYPQIGIVAFNFIPYFCRRKQTAFQNK